jgi:hypothetical protein
VRRCPIEKREGADDLKDAGDDPEPLAEADLIENMGHERNARELCGGCCKESSRHDNLESPRTETP